MRCGTHCNYIKLVEIRVKKLVVLRVDIMIQIVYSRPEKSPFIPNDPYPNLRRSTDARILPGVVSRIIPPLESLSNSE